MISFVVPGKQVSTNAAYRRRGRAGGLYMTPEAKTWCLRMVLAARLAKKGAQALTGPVEVAITYWFDSRRPDADGPTKLVLDHALEESGLLGNDRQVTRYVVTKRLDKDNPRTAISVRPYAEVELVATPEALFDAWDDALTFGIERA